MLNKPLARSVLACLKSEPFAVRYWDDTTEIFGQGEDAPLFTLCLKEPDFFAQLSDDMSFGEAFMNGKIDIDGDVGDVIALAIRNSSVLNEQIPALRLWSTLRNRMTSGLAYRSLMRQRNNVVHHYDLGNDFFRLWLDDSLTYSCAYFRSPEDTLEQAQRNKIEHSLAKLHLQPGETLLDIGCGWGALVLWAAEHYEVRSLGITLSDEQMAGASVAIKARNLEGGAEVRLAHYNVLRQEGRTFDKIVSIGMIEHVGKPYLGEFVATVKTLLKPGGLALLHCITTPQDGPPCTWANKYIFPGTYLPSVRELLSYVAAEELQLWDVENLAPHYRLTLDHWSHRFENARETVVAKYGERFARMWWLYLRGTSACFREGTLTVNQILVSNGNPDPELFHTRE